MRELIALATDEAHPDLSEDDQLLQRALVAAGLDAVATAWDSPSADWTRYSAVVIRSTWDYHKRHEEFLAWLARLEQAGVHVENPVRTLRWNSNKVYLRDLAAANVPVVPTAWIARGAAMTLASLVEAHGWEEMVIKPTVSAAAFQTWRTDGAVSGVDERRFRDLVQERDVMVQPFVPSVAREGEYSLLFFGGHFSHAILKRPRAGDFRVQEELGGTSAAVKPDARLIAQAARVLAAAPTPCLYARVDGCVVDGALLLMELEAVEPSLFFGHDVAAAGRFVAALQESLAVMEP